MDVDAVLEQLDSTAQGLSSDEASRRLAEIGPNALRSHGARPLEVLARQFKNPILHPAHRHGLGVRVRRRNLPTRSSSSGSSASASALGFVNEYRSERAVEELHSQLRHTALVLRDGNPAPLDVTALVPGDVVELAVGHVVPADLRLLRAERLECDESVLSGEAAPAGEQKLHPIESLGVPAGAAAPCAFMGTVVKDGSGRGVVAETGARLTSSG